jgi:hypothetical protein
VWDHLHHVVTDHLRRSRLPHLQHKDETMSTPPPDPGRLIMWLLAIIIFIVLLILLFNLLDLHT